MIIAVDDEDAIMIVIDRKTIWRPELAWLLAFLAELGHERAIVTREYLHSMVVGIGGQQETSMMVERQALRAVELAIGIACLLGANRELDSSISIKKRRSIVCHQSSSNSQSAATTKRCLSTRTRHGGAREKIDDTPSESDGDAATRRRASERANDTLNEQTNNPSRELASSW